MKTLGSVPTLIRQPDSEITEDIDGTLRGSIIFEGPQELISGAPIIGDTHPDDGRLHCYSRRRTYLKLGRARVTCDYLGLVSDPTIPVWELIGSCSEEKIETHPDFVAKIGGKAGAPLNSAVFDEDTGQLIGFPADAPNDLGGTEAYLVPSVTWRKTWWTTRAPAPTDLGSIVARPSDLVLPASVKNGLGFSFSYRQVGFYFQITEDVLGSGKKGFNKLIYS